MLIPFRQGILQYPKTNTLVQTFLVKDAGFITQDLTSSQVAITFAHKNTDYYWTETQRVIHAWGPFVTGTTYWLYWDLDLRSATRTFGATVYPPTSGPVEPTTPLNDQHWFDTNAKIMKVYLNGSWVNKLRVFAAVYNGMDILPPTGINPAHFEGSQVDLPTEAGMVAGRIVFDATGFPIVKHDGTFFTTEDHVFVEGSRVDSIRLDSTVMLAKAVENIPEYHVVKFDANGVRLATYDDATNAAIGMAAVDIPVGNVENIIMQGVVTNPNWNWTSIGAKLWIAPSGPETGKLVTYDFADLAPGTPRTVPVARVLTPTTVMFDQGLGGRGEQGPVGSVKNLPLASTTLLGGVYLTADSPNPDHPLAVGEGDPRLIDARPPLPHSHQAGAVLFAPYQTILNTDVQSAIQFVYDSSLSLDAGGTISGLTLFTGGLQTTKIPTDPNDVVTKIYLDNLLNGMRWINPVCFPNLVADNLTEPPVGGQPGDTYIVQAPAEGGWTGYSAQDVVQLTVAGTWVKLGTLVDLAGCRYGIAHVNATVPGGTFAGKKNQIATYAPTTQTWSYYVPVNKDAYYVNSDVDEFAYDQYTFNGFHWALFGGRPQTYDIGTGLQLHVNTISVVQYDDYVGNPTLTAVDARFLQGLEPSAFAQAGHTHGEITTETLPATAFTKSFGEVSAIIGTYAPLTAQEFPPITSTLAQDMLEEIYVKSRIVPSYTNQSSFIPANISPGILARSDVDNKTYISNGTQYEAIATENWAADKNHTHNFPYDMAYYLAGVHVTNATLGMFAITRNVYVPIGCPGSWAIAEEPAAGPITYELRVAQGGVSSIVGAILFATGANIGTFSLTSPLNLVPGDVLLIRTPTGTADPSIKNVAVTIVGCTVASNCSMV